MTVSLVAPKHGVVASQLFNWRKLEREGALTAVTAGESVVRSRAACASKTFAGTDQQSGAIPRSSVADRPAL